MPETLGEEPIERPEAAGQSEVDRHNGRYVDADPVIADTRHVQDDIRVPVQARPADQGHRQPGQRDHQGTCREASGEPPMRADEQPHQRHRDGHHLVQHGVVEVRDAGQLHLLAQQNVEHQAGDHHLHHSRQPNRVENRRTALGPHGEHHRGHQHQQPGEEGEVHRLVDHVLPSGGEASCVADPVRQLRVFGPPDIQRGDDPAGGQQGEASTNRARGRRVLPSLCS